MKPLLIIAGAGQTGREFSGRLGENWRIVAIDPDPSKLELMRVENEGVERVHGDATSALVLGQSGAESAQAMVALAGIDAVNLEFCRVAIERFGLKNVYSVVTDRSMIEEFTSLGVEVVSRAYSVSSVLQTRIEPGRRTTSEIGLGAGELMEVTVLAHSPVIGRSLASFRAQSWLVGAIYRQGKLVVPHGQTVVQEQDRVLLIGTPDVLPSVADLFRRGESEFPLRYGSSILVADPDREGEGFSFPEALHMVQASHALDLKIMAAPYQDEATLTQICELADVPTSLPTTPTEWPDQVSRLLTAQDCGCLVLPGPHPKFLDWMGLGHSCLFEVLSRAKCPVLLARGTVPYKKVLLLVGPDEEQSRVSELAADVARMWNATLQALAVLPPEFVRGAEHNEEMKRAVETAASIAASYSLHLEGQVVSGHPVHEVVKQSADFDLLVMGYHPRGQRFGFPDAARHVLLRAECSTMVLSI